HRIQFGKVLDPIAEGAGLGGTARRVVLWIKIKDHMFLPAIVRQGDLFTVAGRQSEIGCHIPLLQHLPYTSSGFSVADKGDGFCPSPEEPPIAPAMPKAAPYRRMLPKIGR